MAKVFNADTFNANDRRGREAAIKFFSKKWKVVDNPVEHDIDLICLDKATDEVVGFIEVAVSPTWRCKDFPWSYVNIEERKRHYFQKYKNAFYVKFNDALTSCVLVKGDDIVSLPSEELANSMCDGDMFIRVPFEKAFYYTTL